jgi:hypothetical protein
VKAEDPWSVLRPASGGGEDPLLVGHFVATIFPLGHIKTTESNDDAFKTHFRASPKWLRPK